jgi:hypothetical protein
MHQNFADWYRPVTFGHDRATFDLRWQGVEATLKELNFPVAMELVRLAFGRPSVSTKDVDTFRQYFKAVDPTFGTLGNDHEVQVLAGCVLAILCIDNNYNRSEVLFSILTASACKTRVPKLEFDLLGMATERVRLDGIHARNRPAMSELKEFSFKKDFNKAIADLAASPDFPAAAEAFKQIGVNIENLLIDIQNNINKESDLLQKILTIQDEELQMLWWMVGGWSQMWNTTFGDLDSKARPILLANEAANMTKVLSESPVLKAVFSRVGIDEHTELTVPDAVNACGVEYLKTLVPKSTPCSTIFPLHSAIFRSLETGADRTWIAGWSRTSGIAEEASVVPLELAVQFHRELKLMTVYEAI